MIDSGERNGHAVAFSIAALDDSLVNVHVKYINFTEQNLSS